ncbi:hypothetical protein UNDKW_4060 [Undibacterium sp. KW1]|nr:hypothetical protein UNDKW_4060 [Undibacterium sp. KW1]
MSEINAAFGLLQLKDVDNAIARRRTIDAHYRSLLKDVKGIRCPEPVSHELANCAYFPVMVGPDYPMSRDALYQKLRDHQIFGRRYFYPLLSDFPMYRGLQSAQGTNLPHATIAAQQVLCLPIYPALELEQVEAIVALIAS